MVKIAEEGEFNGEELVLSDDDDADDGEIIDSNNQMQVHNTCMIIRNIF